MSNSRYILRLKWEFSLHWSFDPVYKKPFQSYQIPEALLDISEEGATSCILIIFTFLWQLMSMRPQLKLWTTQLTGPQWYLIQRDRDTMVVSWQITFPIWIFLSKNCFILFHFSFSFVTNVPALVQLMGWHRTGIPAWIFYIRNPRYD